MTLSKKVQALEQRHVLIVAKVSTLATIAKKFADTEDIDHRKHLSALADELREAEREAQ